MLPRSLPHIAYIPDLSTECLLPLFLNPVVAGLPSPATDFQEEGLDLNKHLINKAIELLKEYRTALITNAVTDKIDVRQVSIP